MRDASLSAEEKICSVLEGLRGEESIAELCRCEGIASSMYYGGSKEFLEASVKGGLPGLVRENIVEEETQLANGADSMVASTVDRDDPSRAICWVSAREMTAGWILVVAQIPGVALAIGVEKTASVIGWDA